MNIEQVRSTPGLSQSATLLQTVPPSPRPQTVCPTSDKPQPKGKEKEKEKKGGKDDAPLVDAQGAKEKDGKEKDSK